MSRTPETARTPKLVILKTGSTYPSLKAQFGDFDRWFMRGLGGGLDITVVNVAAGESPGHPEQWDGIVVTGSPAMVTEQAPWSELAGAWLAQAVDQRVPLLGVCYGHQLLAHALGGEVGYHPRGRESGTYQVERLEAAETDPLFRHLPERFNAQLTHRQSVLTLPETAVLLARNSFEPHQAFRVGPCAWGVQFHPEFTDEVMVAYLDVQAPDLEKEQLDPRALRAAVAAAPEASSLLERFAELVRQKQ